jgi:hypothetical protein
VAALDRNDRPQSIGIGGRDASELLAGMRRNTQVEKKVRKRKQIIDLENRGEYDHENL